MKIITVSRTMLADLQTPVGIYLKIRDLYPESVLLESSDYHGGESSYSFVGVQPLARFIVQDNSVSEVYPDGRNIVSPLLDEKTVPDRFNHFIREFRVDENAKKQPFNGFFGYTSYDAVRYFENVNLKDTVDDNSSIPDMYYILYKYVIVVNHFRNELTIVENRTEDRKSEMEYLVELLNSRNFASYDFEAKGEEISPISDHDYMEMVRKGIHHCKRGDTFQIVLSRRFRQSFSGDDFKVYRALRSINPSPYLFYFDFGSFRIFGSSPETHLKTNEGRAYIDPIAGTFRRTGDDEKDRLLVQELLKDPKENAEHVMLVDLARNDLSRNCTGVRLDIYKKIQFYSHVIHMVSTVSGEIMPGTNPVRLYADTFPAGTLSGAPKIKAMQLISDIESHGRGFYGGCIGYIGLDGEINQAITIRAFLSKNNTLYYQAGAGIVSKSVPEKELQEVNHKLGALKQAISLAVKLNNV
ncbi:MAG: anthranilate synthase component I family protein [Dysgonamonadaceae bacterium]|jgi:anthranilate synthase component 1|nr:anthranilate synthase component I family protein [Dysgonamonadaceae bacterium]